ncbi:MAG: CRISPR-associated endoribonuclease Cas6 [Microcystis aeruginosa S11-01]|jgi:CRISPR-associated endoribonuclease Cas6|nr:CRISPR-associated endoribonuclease Cas6 [Microcystis aeruginosa S11-05]NCR50423.1 CRISPR-associated endoribonuclease Cas6 [Microcystis aeruginosa S11-01]
MPYSLVLNLTPRSPIYPNFLTGRHLHALFLTLVSSVDQELGDTLHAAEGDKAFTLSPLQIQSGGKITINSLRWRHEREIAPETPCWWRISLLDDRLFGKLTSLWLNLNPQHPWHLGSADLVITSVLATPQSVQPWANSCTYQYLYENASETNREFHFLFVTPVTFRQGKFDSALPTRELVFNSLLGRWNRYSGIPFDSIALESIFPSFFDIQTKLADEAYKNQSIGCVGEIHYRLLGEVEPAKIKAINALADFALYAGVGRKTTMGMGMTRRIAKDKR